MRAGGVLGAVEAAAGEKAREVRGRDTKDLLSEDVVDALL